MTSPEFIPGDLEQPGAAVRGQRRRLTAGTVTLLSTSSMLTALRPRYNMLLQCPRLPRGLVREKGAVVLTCRSLTWTPLETSQLGQRRVLNKRSGHLCRNIQGLNFRRNLNKPREVLKEKAMSGFPGIDLPGLKCSLLGGNNSINHLSTTICIRRQCYLG